MGWAVNGLVVDRTIDGKFVGGNSNVGGKYSLEVRSEVVGSILLTTRGKWRQSIEKRSQRKQVKLSRQ